MTDILRNLLIQVFNVYCLTSAPIRIRLATLKMSHTHRYNLSTFLLIEA